MAWKFFAASGAEKRAPATVVNPQALIYHNTTQSIANSTATAVALNTVLTDTAGMTGTANKITITKAGRYQIVASAAFAANATGLRQLYTTINTTAGTPGALMVQASPTLDTQLTTSAVADLNIGDVIAMNVQQSSGGALNIQAASTIGLFQCSLSVTKIDGAVVSYVGVPGSLIGQEVAYQERTTNMTVNTIAEAAATTYVTAPAYTFDGVSAYYVEFYCPGISWGGSTTGGINLWLDGVDQGRLVNLSTVANVADNNPLGTARRRVVPTAGSHTFSVRAWAGASNLVLNAGAGGAGVDLPAFIRIVRAA